MSHRPFRQQEWTQLIGNMLDGRLDEVGTQRLESILRKDPKARSYYLRYVGLHVGLKYSMSPEPSDLPALCDLSESLASPTPSVKSGVSFLEFLGKGTQNVTHFITRDLPFALIFAVGIPFLLLIVVAVVLFSEHLEDKAVSVRPPMVVAKLTKTFGCRWANGSSNIPIGQSIFANTSLGLKSGFAELATVEGAQVTIEGPANIRFNDSKWFMLESGNVVVDVPEQAVGFTVQTPHTKVVDLGTNFGIAVEEGKQSSVCVFKGEVEVETKQAGGRNAQGRLVQAGYGVCVNSNTKTIAVQPIEQMEVQLVREVPVSRRLVFRNGLDDYEGNQAAFIRTCATASSPDVTKASLNDAKKNFGNAVRLFTCRVPAGHTPPECSRSLMEFKDIVGEQRGRIPPGAKILSAVLRLHVVDEKYAADDENGKVTLHEVLVPWSEANVTWKNFNSGGKEGVNFKGRSVSSISPVKINSYYDMNVTASVQRWANGDANNGWILIESMNRVHYDSDDSKTDIHRPTLVVEYTFGNDNNKTKKGKRHQ